MSDLTHANIELIGVTDSRPETESGKLELWIDEKAVSEVYFADGKWKISMSSLEGVVTIYWLDFLDVINRFHKFIASESEVLVAEAKTSQSD